MDRFAQTLAEILPKLWSKVHQRSDKLFYRDGQERGVSNAIFEDEMWKPKFKRLLLDGTQELCDLKEVKRQLEIETMLREISPLI